MKLTQKQFFIAGLCLIAFVVIAANPSFTDFIASQFDTSGNVVKIKSGVVLTNVSEWGPMTVSDSVTASNGFFSLGTAAGELVLGQGSGTGGIFDYSGATKSNQLVITDGAGRFISTNDISGLVPSSPQVWTNNSSLGSIYIPALHITDPAASNVVVIGVAEAEIDSYIQGWWSPQAALFTSAITNNVGQDQAIAVESSGDTTGPANNVRGIGVISVARPTSNSSGSATGIEVNVAAIGNKDLGNVFGVVSRTTGNDGTGTLTNAYQFYAEVPDEGHGPILNAYGLYVGDQSGPNITNAWSVFTAGSSPSSFGGVVTANGFTDASGTPGSLVAYQGGNRLGPTNATFVTIIDTTYFTNNLSYITNLFTTYITNNLAYITNLFSSYTTNNTSYITNLNVFTTVNNFASNYIAGVDTMATNANNTTPDFAVMGSTLSTNNNFKWLPPTHLDTTGKAEQWIITHITNSLGTLITMTAPDNVHVCGGGAMNVTNWTEIRWQYYPPSGPTNCWPSPGY